MLFNFFFNKIRYCLNLGIGACFTNHKKIRYRLRYFTQIEGNDFFSFFPLYSADNSFKELTVSVQTPDRFWLVIQKGYWCQ